MTKKEFIKKWNVAYENKEQQSEFKNEMLNDLNSMKDIKTKRGGKRKGAGRPKKEPTKTVSFRVELKHVEPVKKLVNTYLTNLKNEK